MTRPARCAGISTAATPGAVPGTGRNQGARLDHIAAALPA
jgi:hypothetical protein